MNLAACFDAFLERHVNLNPDRIKTLTERVETIKTFLAADGRLGSYLKDMIPQGSFAQRTIIKPPETNDTFDADVLVQLPVRMYDTPGEYVPGLAGAFEGRGRYENKIDPGTRSVTVDYAGEFHIDLVPYVVGDNGHFITNADENAWEKTNPQGFNDWLAERDDAANARLVEVIRLAKYLRECSDVEFKAPSVTLTLLLGQMVDDAAAGQGAYNDLPSAFITLMRALDKFLWANATRPQLPDPTCEAQNFHDRWDHDDYATCRQAIHDLVALIDDALDAGTDDEQLSACQKIFGDRFTVPDDVAESERGRVGEQFLDRDYKIPFRPTHTVSIDAHVQVAGAQVPYRLADKKNQVDRFRNIAFTYTTSAPTLGHEVYWKPRNTGKEAAAARCFRGEIHKGMPGCSRTEPTKYRGQHSMEVFIVVDGFCVATAVQQVHIL
jgi:hypothetical protein